MIDHRDVGILFLVIGKDRGVIDTGDAVAIRDDNIVLVSVIQKTRNALERLETVRIRDVRFIGIRRKKNDTAVLTCEIPILTASEMIEKGLIVVLRDDADRRNSRIHHIGKREIDQTITSAVRDGRHRSVTGELRNVFIMYVGKNNSHCGICHCDYSPL